MRNNMSEESKPHVVKSHDIGLDSDYVRWVHDVKQRYVSAQIKSAVKVNTEQLFFNWQLGRDLVEWGYAMRCSIATVVVFWTFVEVLGRWNIFHEIWVEPMAYTTEMITILLAFLALLAFLFYQSAKKKNSHN